MGIFRKLASLFSGAPPSRAETLYLVTVQCQRCGEVLRGAVNLGNELSEDFDEASGATTYHVRKVLMGSGRCFQPIEVTLKFDEGRRLLERQITGGKFTAA
jgi:hypothetical protein